MTECMTKLCGRYSKIISLQALAPYILLNNKYILRKSKHCRDYKSFKMF